MNSECSICTIPEREELLYSNEEIFLVQTKQLKGHDHRIMACIYEHRKEPTFTERSNAYAIVNDYMNRVMNGEEWLLVEDKFASLPDHWHLIASCKKGTPEELEALKKTPTVIMPIATHRVMIGIPALNEEKHIREVVIKAKAHGRVVVVDDGSTDDTALIAADAGAEVIRFHKNLGYGSALERLFVEANKVHDVLITLDGDGQHNPDEIPLFLKALKDADMVTGNRFMGKTNIPSYRAVGVEFISNLVGIEDSQCGFRAYNKKAIRTTKITEHGMGASIEILRRAKENELIIKEVPCTILYDDAGHSQNPIKQGITLLAAFFWGKMWNNPIVALGIPSVISLAIGTAFLIWLLLEYSQVRWFSPSLAFISLGGLIMGTLLGLSTIFILVGKRLLEELK